MILRAEWVVPVTVPPIRDGCVEFAGDRITGVGPAGEFTVAHSRVPSEYVDLGRVVLTPGLVNPHTHLELSCYAGALPRAPLWEWIARLIVLRRAPGQVERETAAATAGGWDSLRAGVTCVGDISRRNIAWRGLQNVPVRKVCFAELLSIADHPPRNPSELTAALDEMPGDDRLLTRGISPHAPYTVPADQIAAAISLARQRDLAWTTHWAETREEVAFLAGDPAALPAVLNSLAAAGGIAPPGAKPGEFLRRLTEGTPGAVVHGNYLTSADMAVLAADGHTLVYCPRAHEFFGHSPYPLRAALDAGVTVAVGTDSPASNWGVGMLDELNHVWRNHADLGLTPVDVFKMGTVHAARALRLEGRVGALAAGYLADVAVFQLDASGPHDPIREILERPRPASTVYVGGERVLLAD